MTAISLPVHCRLKRVSRHEERGLTHGGVSRRSPPNFQTEVRCFPVVCSIVKIVLASFMQRRAWVLVYYRDEGRLHGDVLYSQLERVVSTPKDGLYVATHLGCVKYTHNLCARHTV